MEPLLIVSRDAQPDVLHGTPLERELAIAEGQADLLRRERFARQVFQVAAE